MMPAQSLDWRTCRRSGVSVFFGDRAAPVGAMQLHAALCNIERGSHVSDGTKWDILEHLEKVPSTSAADLTAILAPAEVSPIPPPRLQHRRCCARVTWFGFPLWADRAGGHNLMFT